MRFSSSVVSVVVLAAAAAAAPITAQSTLDALEREVASLLPALRSDNLSSRLPTAATLVSVLEQAASDIANDGEGVTSTVMALVDDMTVAVHDALGASGAPLADSIDSALDRLLRVTSISPDELPDRAVPALVMNPAT
ncbi:hypothetical protein AURDEDRAFT_159896 [Auricularia subglabra TFB-10046 SS5]|nr:hypothetical protein AURDEDRAFT_159896 [Auricularia subglabra TFB-10046 SS5]